MKKRDIKYILIILGCLFVITLYIKFTDWYSSLGMSSENVYLYDFSNVEGIMSFLPNRSYTERCKYGDGINTIYFNSDGKCIIKSIDKRTDQVKYSYNGTYQVGFSKYTDNGRSFKYIRIDWESGYSRRPMCYSFFGESRIVQIKNFDGFDNYGPLVKSFYSEGGLVDDCYVYR